MRRGSISVVNLTSTVLPVRVRFQGQLFGTDWRHTTVSYGPAGLPLLYPCALTGPSDLNMTMITCTTVASVGVNMHFQVKVGQFVTSQGHDILSFPGLLCCDG